jgi:hypothetical protein
MKKIYEIAKKQGKSVDHLVPLCNKRVCGLNWEGNLGIIDKIQNSRKRNHWWQDMWNEQTDFFGLSNYEQLELNL